MDQSLLVRLLLVRPWLDRPLQSIHFDGAVAGMQVKQCAAIAYLSMHALAANASTHLDRHIEIDLTIAGEGFKVSREICRQLQVNAAIACAHRPVAIHL